MAVTQLDGRAFEKFVAAGTYFLRKYRGVLNDLNVFPVPDGDTGSNMYLTAKAALREAAQGARQAALRGRGAPPRTARCSGARGNSGVILSQMLRGFAHSVRHRDAIDTFQLVAGDARGGRGGARGADQAGRGDDPLGRGRGRRRGVPAGRARAGLLPAGRRRAARRERRARPHPRAAPGAQGSGRRRCGRRRVLLLPRRRAAVLCPSSTTRTTAFPRRPVRSSVFTRRQVVGDNHCCTEFVLEDATVDAHPLRDELERLRRLAAGDRQHRRRSRSTSTPPSPTPSRRSRRGTGRVTRWKREDMAQQHNLLVVDAPAKAIGIAAVVPGRGLRPHRARARRRRDDPGPGRREPLGPRPAGRRERVARADRLPAAERPERRAGGARGRGADREDGDRRAERGPRRRAGGAAAARRRGPRRPARRRWRRRWRTFAARRCSSPARTRASAASAVQKGAPAASIGKRLLTAPSLGEVIGDAVARARRRRGGLVTLYYGGAQKERDAQKYAAAIGERFAGRGRGVLLRRPDRGRVLDQR